MADHKRLNISAMILAAGLSSRFHGRLKALELFGGRTLLRRAADNFHICGLTRLAVITGHERTRVEEAARAAEARPVFNPDFKCGMFSSVLAGLPCMKGADAFFIQPVDGALVHPQTLLSLMTAWSRAGRKRRSLIFVPVHDGRAGHPLLVGGNRLNDIAGWPGDEGLRGWLASLMPEEEAGDFLADRIQAPLAGPVVFLKLPDAALTCDIDTPDDLAAAREPVGVARPSVAEAWTLLRQSGLKPAKMRHSVLVAAGALRLGAALAAAGRPEIDLDLYMLSGLLHDLARRESNHALVGRLRAEALGWPKLALIIGAHTDPPAEVLRRLNIQPKPAGSEESADPPGYERLSDPLAEVCLAVYLADKYFLDDGYVGIKHRFRISRARLRSKPAALAAVDRREKTALAVEARFRKILGRKPEDVVLEPTADRREKLLDRLI